MKRFILMVLATLLVACGTATCVILPKKFEYDKLQQEQSAETDLQQSSLSELVENLLGTSTYEGDICFYSYDKSTNISGKLRLLNEENLKLSLELNGTINGTPFDTKFTYANSTLFCDYNDLKLYCTTNDAMGIISEIMSQADASIESIIDTTMLQEMLDNIVTEEYSNGSITRINLPFLNEVVLVTNENSFPTSLEATNIEVAGNHFALKVKIKDSLSSTITTPAIEEYINFAPSTKIINGIFKTYHQLPLRIAGTISIGSTNVHANIKIDKDFNIEAILNYNGITAKAYYVDNSIMFNFYNIYAKMSTSEFVDLLGLSTNTLPSSFAITDLTQNMVSVGDVGSIILDYNFDGTIRKLALDLGIVSAEFSLTMTEGSVVSPNPSTVLTAQNIKSIVSKYTKMISNDYSLTIDATVGNKPVSGNVYLHTKDFTTISKFLFDGTINNINVLIAYKDNNYYLKVGSIKAKFSNGCITDMLNVLSDKTGASTTTIDEVVSTISSSITKLSLTKSGQLNINLSQETSIQVKPFSSEAQISFNDLNVGGLVIDANIALFPNNSTYAKKIETTNFAEYVDCSNTNALTNALLNTLNSKSHTLSGSLRISLGEWNLIDVSTSIRFENSNGKQRIVINLASLPTSALFTQHNAFFNKHQSSTIIFEDDTISVTRYLHKRFTNEKVAAYKATMKISEIELSDIADFLGIKQELLTSASSKEPAKNFDKTSLFNLLSVSESKLLSSLKTSAFVKNLSDCDISIAYNSKISAISASLSYSSLFFISFNLSE